MNWRQYSFYIEDDGSFRIEDVKPGKYEFYVTLEENQTGQKISETTETGGYFGTVEIPPIMEKDNNEPFDLSDLVLKIYDPLEIGATAPLFEVKTIDGNDIRLIDYRGKYVLLSSWLPGYYPELEQVKEFYNTYEDNQKLVVIGLSGYDTIIEVQKYIRENNITWPQIYLGEDMDSSIVQHYGLYGSTWAFLINPEGIVVARKIPGENFEKFQAVVEEAIIPQYRDYEAAGNEPQPLDLWKIEVNEKSILNASITSRTQQKLKEIEKEQYPILLSWPLIKDAYKYVVQLRGVRGSQPAKSFELKTNSMSLKETDIAPGRYQWSVSVYDEQGNFMGNIETINPVQVFAIEDLNPVTPNGKRCMIDLNHSAGQIDGWGIFNHSQYMIKELLENAGFEVEVNDRDLLTEEKLKSIDLLICNYYWVGWPYFRPFLESELSAVHKYIENGGSLLVIGCDRKDGGGNMYKAGNELVKEFDIKYELDGISKDIGLAPVSSNQSIISFNKSISIQLPLSVQDDNAATLLQFDSLPIVKAKQIGKGKVIIAGVGMSFLDCYLGDFESREPLHLIMFYDFIKYLTNIDWKKYCKQEFINTVLSRYQS